MKLYHGSTNKVEKPSMRRGRANTDFGKGFYTTTNFEQAKKWAIIKKNRSSNPDITKAIVSFYEVDDDILEKGFNVKHFNGATKDWLEFVTKNRKIERRDVYDLVMGPVANDKLYATLLLYEQGTLSVEATIEQLKTHTLFDQLSFHSDTVMKELRFLKAENIVD